MALLNRLGFRLKKTTLAHQFPYPHEHSRHAAYAVLAGSLFFISSDNLQNLLNRFDSNIKWWAIYGFLLGFFYFFASPFLGKVSKAPDQRQMFTRILFPHSGAIARRKYSWSRLWVRRVFSLVKLAEKKLITDGGGTVFGVLLHEVDFVCHQDLSAALDER